MTINTRRRDIAWKALNTPELLTDGERKTAIDLFAEKHDLLVSEDKKIEKATYKLNISAVGAMRQPLFYAALAQFGRASDF